MLDRAKRLFFDACTSDGDLRQVLLCSSGVLEYVLAALAFANSSYVRKGAVRAEDELARFEVVPEGFERALPSRHQRQGSPCSAPDTSRR